MWSAVAMRPLFDECVDDSLLLPLFENQL